MNGAVTYTGTSQRTPAAIRYQARRARTFADAYDLRRNNFDALRFGLATLVIWSHCFPLSGRPQDWFTHLSGQIDGGSLAVDGFFVLSGFLVTQSWLSVPQLGIFAIKRALRILPALAFAVAFGTLIVGPMARSSSILDYFEAPGPWLHAFGVVLHRWLMIPGVFADNPLANWMNAPMWSLRYEVACYGMVALVGLAFRRSFARVTTLIFAASLTAPWLFPGLQGLTATCARLAACFSAGMAFYVWRDRVPYHWGVSVVAMALLTATFLGGGFRTTFPLAGGYLLFYLAFKNELGVTGFGRHGDFSYGLYVLAYPIQQLIIAALGTSISVTTFFLLSFPPSLALAMFSWHWIEAPALAHKPRPTHQAAA